MSRVAFKQCDLERVLRALKTVGDSDRAVEIRLDGAIRLLTRSPGEPVASKEGADDLDAELEAWRREHGDD